jgi:hypothetical protein
MNSRKQKFAKLRWQEFSQGAGNAMRLVAPYQGGF